MSLAAAIGDNPLTDWRVPGCGEFALPDVVAHATIGIVGEPKPEIGDGQASSIVLSDDEDLPEDEDADGIETPDFEGLEDFDDEDFDDEFDDDFEEELEDEYDFDEFDEQVTEEDLEEAEGKLPLVGDFVDEDEEEEKVVEEVAPPEAAEEGKPKKRGKKANPKDGIDED